MYSLLIGMCQLWTRMKQTKTNLLEYVALPPDETTLAVGDFKSKLGRQGDTDQSSMAAIINSG